jgi:glycosyltransferase involved in cell wall biosynthesis
MQAKTKISVLLLAHNDEKSIEKSVKNVLGQTYRNLEFIICANGCTDNTIHLIGKTIAKNVVDVYFTALPVQNKSKAIKWMWQIATGDFILIKEVNDNWEQNMVENQVNLFHRYGTAGTLIKHIPLPDDLRQFEFDTTNF